MLDSPSPSELDKRWQSTMEELEKSTDLEQFVGIAYTTGAGLALPGHPQVALGSALQVAAVAGRALAADTSQSHLLFVGVDISGIQTFLYSITRKGAAKSLKGRSMYLKLLPEALLRRLNQDVYGTPDGLSVYCSGGGFYTLLPASAHQTITNLQREAETKAWDDLEGKVYPALAYVDRKIDDLKSSKAGTHWNELTKALGEAKNKRWAHTLTHRFSELFTTPKEPHHKDNKGNEPIKDTKDEAFEDFATKLRTANSLRVMYNPIAQNSEKHELNPINLGIIFSFVENKSTNAPLQYALRLEGNAPREWLSAGLEVPLSKKGAPITFDEMANEGEPQLKRLGILRMDVDNLGKLFQERGRDESWSLARAASLSYALDYFFRGKLDSIWKNTKNAKQCTQVLYAGGDDLFLLGRWDAVLDLADAIQAQFSEWAQGSAVSLSGGIAIVPDSYPLARAASDAEDVEKLAKQHKYGTDEKNAFAILNHSLNWKHEWPLVKTLCTFLETKLAEPGTPLPEGLLQTLYQFAEMQRNVQLEYEDKNLKQANAEKHRWRWLAAYDLARLRDRIDEKKHPEERKFVSELLDAVATDSLSVGNQWGSPAFKPATSSNSQPFIVYAGLAARLAAFRRRMDGNS